MHLSITKRRLMTTILPGILFLAGCSSESAVSGNLALTNSSGESAEVTVKITDQESGDRILNDSYQVPASDDGILIEDVVTTPGSYELEASVTDSDESTSGVWRLPSDDDQDYYSIRISVLSDGSLSILR